MLKEINKLLSENGFVDKTYPDTLTAVKFLVEQFFLLNKDKCRLETLDYMVEQAPEENGYVVIECDKCEHKDKVTIKKMGDDYSIYEGESLRAALDSVFPEE